MKFEDLTPAPGVKPLAYAPCWGRNLESLRGLATFRRLIRLSHGRLFGACRCPKIRPSSC